MQLRGGVFAQIWPYLLYWPHFPALYSFFQLAPFSRFWPHFRPWRFSVFYVCIKLPTSTTNRNSGRGQETSAPFINAIYDRDPIPSWAFGRVVLLGEAAHPASPHGLRATNMAICDAAALGEALAKSPHNLEAALEAYQARRVPRTAEEVAPCSYFGAWIMLFGGGVSMVMLLEFGFC